MDKYFMVLLVLLTFSVLCQCNSLESTFTKRLNELEGKMASYTSLREKVTRLRDHVMILEKRDMKKNGCTCRSNYSFPLTNGKRFIEPPTFVAFSAFVDNNPNHIGLEQPVPYNHIITNIGGGFNQHTHTFTCPVSGIYMFTFTICHQLKTEFVAKLVVDNQHILDAISQPTVDWEEIQGTNTAIIQCNSLESTFTKRLNELEGKMASYTSLREEVTRLRDHVMKLEKRDMKKNGCTCRSNYSFPLTNGKRFIEPPTFVAFSAFVDNNPNHIGLEQPVPYNHIITNIGGGFNQHTHTFTCPVSGIYMFTFTICHQLKTEFVAKLVVDNQHILDAISQPTVDWEEIQGTNTAIIQVNKGQSVWVAVYYHSDITIRSDNTYRFAAFSGYLIQATQQ